MICLLWTLAYLVATRPDYGQIKIVMQIMFVSLLAKRGNIVSFRVMLSIVGTNNCHILASLLDVANNH